MSISFGFNQAGFITIEYKKNFLYFLVFYPFCVWGRGENWHDNLVFDFGLGPFFRIIKYYNLEKA